MPNVARPEELAAPEALVSRRHRAPLTESFPTRAAVDPDVQRAASDLVILLADPLGEVARTSTDARARALALGALERFLRNGAAASDGIAAHAGLEDALDRIASTTSDAAARALAEDAVALYRGR